MLFISFSFPVIAEGGSSFSQLRTVGKLDAALNGLECLAVALRECHPYVGFVCHRSSSPLGKLLSPCQDNPESVSRIASSLFLSWLSLVHYSRCP